MARLSVSEAPARAAPGVAAAVGARSGLARCGELPDEAYIRSRATADEEDDDDEDADEDSDDSELGLDDISSVSGAGSGDDMDAEVDAVEATPLEEDGPSQIPDSQPATQVHARMPPAFCQHMPMPSACAGLHARKEAVSPAPCMATQATSAAALDIIHYGSIHAQRQAGGLTGNVPWPGGRGGRAGAHAQRAHGRPGLADRRAQAPRPVCLHAGCAASSAGPRPSSCTSQHTFQPF
jgi:hypothetical protein